MEEFVLVTHGRFASNHDLDSIRNSCNVLSLKDDPFNPFDKPEKKNLTQDIVCLLFDVASANMSFNISAKIKVV